MGVLWHSSPPSFVVGSENRVAASGHHHDGLFTARRPRRCHQRHYHGPRISKLSGLRIQRRCGQSLEMTCLSLCLPCLLFTWFRVFPFSCRPTCRKHTKTYIYVDIYFLVGHLREFSPIKTKQSGCMMERLVARPLDRTFVNAMFIILATTAIVTKLVRGKKMFGFTFGWTLPWSVAFNHKFHFIKFYYKKSIVFTMRSF